MQRCSAFVEVKRGCGYTQLLGQNARYITVGFVWLFLVDDGAAGEGVTARQGDVRYGYQLAALLCFLLFADNRLRRIEGPGEAMWWC